MSHQIIMITPRVNAYLSMPEEYHVTAEIDCESQETQEASIGKAVVSAVLLAQSHPNHAHFTDLHFTIMFATVESMD